MYFTPTQQFFLSKREFEALYKAVCLKVIEVEFNGKLPPKLDYESPGIFQKPAKNYWNIGKMFTEFAGTSDLYYFARSNRLAKQLQKTKDRNEIPFHEGVLYNCLVYLGISSDKEDKLLINVHPDDRDEFMKLALSKTEILAKLFFQGKKIDYTHKYSDKPQVEGTTKAINAEAMRLGNDEHTKKFLKTLRENGLEKFMIQPVHYYYSTKSENGKLYWCHAIFDFTTPVSPDANFLQALSEIPNLTKSLNIKYSAKIIKDSPDDPILLSIRYQGTHEKICHNIFDNMRSYDKCAGGFLYHDDWMGEMRLSPCLLSFEKLTDQNTVGALLHEQCLSLQTFWNEIFTKNGKKAMFEEYKSSYK